MVYNRCFVMASSTLRSDSALVTDLKLGIAEAVTIWYKEYHPVLFKFVQTKITPLHDCEEVVRDTFVSCLRQLPLFKGNSSLKTWMIQICKHEVADYYRRHYAKKFIKAIPLSPYILAETHNIHESSQYVVDILKHMKNEYKELLMLKYVDKISVKDIATQMHRSMKSVESDLFRARKEFKSLYDTMNLSPSEI